MPDFVVRPSTKIIKFRYGLTLVLAAGIALSAWTSEERLLLLLVIPVLLLAGTVARHLAVRFTKLVLANGKLRFEQGLLSRSTRSLELEKIQDVRVDQSLGGRLLGIGTLTLETAGESGRLAMTDIDRPQDVADRILDMARRRSA